MFSELIGALTCMILAIYVGNIIAKLHFVWMIFESAMQFFQMDVFFLGHPLQIILNVIYVQYFDWYSLIFAEMCFQKYFTATWLHVFYFIRNQARDRVLKAS